MKERIAAIGVVAVMLLGACDDVTDLPTTGGSDGVIAPASILGRTLTMTIRESLTACTADAGTTLEHEFIDENTIRYVQTGGRSHTLETESWVYERRGASGGYFRLNYTNGTYSTTELNFTSEAGGTYESKGYLGTAVGSFPCSDPVTHFRGPFTIE